MFKFYDGQIYQHLAQNKYGIQDYQTHNHHLKTNISKPIISNLLYKLADGRYNTSRVEMCSDHASTSLSSLADFEMFISILFLKIYLVGM